MKTLRSRHHGFTLVEIAIVMAIMALLLTSGLTVLSTQIEQQKFKDTQKILEDAKDALIGYAVANGRLPCPATAATNGIESPVGGGLCTNPYDGFLPAATLGLPGVDNNGFLTDAWQTPANRIRYAVSIANQPTNPNAATTTDGIRNASIATFAPDLNVCSTSTGITNPGAPTAACAAAARLSQSAVAVIFSLGKNAPATVTPPPGPGIDEQANLTIIDRVFVSHAPTGSLAPNGEFDDMMTWLPASILLNRMIQAGRLP